ncbi:Hypothetical protein D9617_1g080770 [Elsinoe fawcettii]|nr:Hypothetical protein D9617_1g080770 [Elsinoe fawcettii]
MALKRPRDRKAFEIAIICTSPLEADVMLPILDQTWQGDEDLRKTSGDKNGYTCGSVGKHYVVLVRLPEMGGIDVTTAARAVNMSFPNVQLAVVTGMYGGIPKPAGSENIRLGDLITRHAVAQYDFERQYPTGIRGRAGVLDLLGHPSPLMRSFLAKLQAEEYYENYREIPINVYESANTVIKSGLDHDEVAQHTDPIAQKMAGAGAWNSFPCCLVVKSVCDYADNHKSKEWETYAATVAAAGAKALLQELQSPKQFSTTSTSTTSVNKHWMVQRPNKVMFTGREAELKRLRDILDIYLSTDNQEDQYRIVVTGVGGIGKSELLTQSSFLSLQNGFKDVVRAGDNVVLQGLWQPFLTAWHVENLPGWMYDILKPHEGTTSSSNEPFYIVSESTNAIADVQSSYTQLDRIAAATGLLNRLSLTTLASSGTSKLISMHPLVHAWARERQQHLEREAPWITTACLITDVLGDTPYPRFREGALTIHLAALAEGIPVESLLHDATSEILVATELQLLWRAIQFHCSAANELMKHITGTYNAHTATHICPPRESNEHGARRSVQILSQSAAMLLTAASSPRAAEIVATYVRTRVRLFFSLTLDLNRAEPPYGRDGARFNRLSHIAASDWLRFAKVSQIQRTKIRIEPLLALLLDRVRALSYARDELDRASSKPILDQTHVKTGDMDEDAGLLKLVRRALQIVSLDSGVVGKEKRQTARTLPVLLRMRRETCRYCVARTSTIGMPGDSVARNETASEKLRKRQLKHTFSDSSSKDVPRMSVSSAGEDGTSVSSSTHNDPEWAQELTAMGYSDQEIAELLLQQASEAPWIFGDDEIITMNDSSTSWHLDFHRRSCAHRYGEGVTNAGDSLADQALYSREQDAESRKVKEALDNILGLAGVQPCRQQSGGWVSGVKFLCNNTSCAISYLEYRIKDEERHSFHLERIKNSIKRTLQGIAILQNAGMCCDSITAIIDNDHQGDRIVRRAISLHPITLHTILDFRVSLDQILTDDTPNDITKKTFHALSHFLTPFLGEDLPDVDPLSLCAIVAQYLSLACLSYSRAHIGSIRTKFLDTAQDAFHLLGLGHTELLGSSNACIAARLLPLECLGRLTEQPVLAFSWRSRWGDLKQATEGRYHLSCKMDSFLDTFGPGQLIRRVSPSGEIEQAVAMAVGGGLLVAITEDSSHVSQRDVPATITDTSSRRGTSDREGDVTIAHWTCEDDIDLSKLPPLDLMARFLIGSPITINNGCQQDISASRTRLVPNMRHLGTGRPYWRPSERQLAAQVGQYVVVQAMQTATKIEGVTLKEICLAGQDRDIIEFLEGPWGLQVSACTRVSRRVSLRELVHDLLPIFTNNAVVLNDADWQALQACQVYDALSYDVQCWKQWLEALTNECRAFLVDSVRQILRSLQHTGVSKDGSYFLIAWPHPGCTQSCLEISCQPKENQWLCVLADSMDCATFAYVTSKCLESEHSSCSAQPFWLNSITALGTAVSRLYCAKVSHGSCPSPFPPKLDVEKEYWLTKMNTVLRIAVSRSQNAATTYLHASKK